MNRKLISVALRRLSKFVDPEKADSDTDTRPPMALIVEDNREHATDLKMTLQDIGWSSKRAPTPRVALEMLDEYCDYDAIMVDIMFAGDMNGFEFVDALEHREDKSRDIPVVFVSGAPESFLKAKPSSFVCYLVKPIMEKALRKALRACNGQKKHREGKERGALHVTATAAAWCIGFLLLGIAIGTGWLDLLIKSLMK